MAMVTCKRKCANMAHSQWTEECEARANIVAFPRPTKRLVQYFLDHGLTKDPKKSKYNIPKYCQRCIDIVMPLQVRMMSTSSWVENCSRVEGVLLDISGVLYDSGEGGGIPIPGSIDAVERLKSSCLKVRFCTNETQCTTQHIVDKLSRLGFDIKPHELFSPAPAACQLLREKSLKPFLLLHPDAWPDFSEFDLSEPHDCVVIGDAALGFNYENMNQAFRVLIKQEKPMLISMGRGRYYKETDGLMLDVGAFKAALEYAVGCEAVVVGKPAEGFFMSALKSMDVKPENAIMVGDDIVNDVGGAQKCGIMGLQVRTGKFRPSDEQHPSVKPDGFVDNLAEAVDLLLKNRRK